ncbi:MAG: aminofutalosine synthase MqnE [Phycisphaerales bacterium]|nr:aminofutalosine synthase MqnE [Phycisphaerales bacterium]
MTPTLRDIAAKVDGGERLSLEEGMALFRTSDLWGLCRVANRVRERLHGRRAYYNVNRHVNYTNICALSCKFCSFYRKKDDDGAYEYDVQAIADEAAAAEAAGATEIHIVGGLHPWQPFSYYTDMLGAIRERAPKLHIKAFTAVEIVHLARIAKRPNDIAGVLRDLKEAGLGSLPGGGAEVFDDRVHDEAFKGKIRSDKWLQVHREAHKLGMNTNATILYGHIESLEDRLHHMDLLRTAQDEAIAAGPGSGRFQTIIPLPFIPDDSELEHLPGPSGVENLRMLAVCRLMLDNFAHVKTFWIMQTLEMAELMLQAGADDIDGTVVWYDITKVGGSDTHQETDVKRLRRAIRDAGYEPVERDTLYRPVVREGAQWRVAEAVAV